VKGEGKTCSICGVEYGEQVTATILSEAGEWLSEEFWKDSGDLCHQCLENRAKLAMMYVIDR
jgi:hypothetical protein